MKEERKKVKLIYNQKYFAIYIISALVLISSLISFFALRNLTKQIDAYNNNLSEVLDHITEFNEYFSERTAKLSSAELLMNNTNLILSTVYFATADTE